MRAFRQRTWAPLTINMTPLIDVVFLIIIFFLMMINFSDILTRDVVLPQADEARESQKGVMEIISVTIKSEALIFVGGRQVALDRLAETLKLKVLDHRRTTVQLRGDEDLPYVTVEKVMGEIAASGISRIEFSARNEPEAVRGARP